MASTNQTIASLLPDMIAAADCPEAAVSYLFVYGSQVHDPANARDIDALLVSPHVRPTFICKNIAGHILKLHVTTEAIVNDDILTDRYGWMFLTKFLDDFVLLHDTSGASLRSKASAYLRLCGQYCATRGTYVFPSYSGMSTAITTVLTEWNPQFSKYVETGRIDCRRYSRYLTGVFRQCMDTDEHLNTHDQMIVFASDSPFCRRADLRTILARYWAYYVAYKLNPASYLCDSIEALFRGKGLV